MVGYQSVYLAERVSAARRVGLSLPRWHVLLGRRSVFKVQRSHDVAFLCKDDSDWAAAQDREERPRSYTGMQTRGARCGQNDPSLLIPDVSVSESHQNCFHVSDARYRWQRSSGRNRTQQQSPALVRTNCSGCHGGTSKETQALRMAPPNVVARPQQPKWAKCSTNEDPYHTLRSKGW